MAWGHFGDGVSWMRSSSPGCQPNAGSSLLVRAARCDMLLGPSAPLASCWTSYCTSCSLPGLDRLDRAGPLMARCSCQCLARGISTVSFKVRGVSRETWEGSTSCGCDRGPKEEVDDNKKRVATMVPSCRTVSRSPADLGTWTDCPPALSSHSQARDCYKPSQPQCLTRTRRRPDSLR